MEGYHEPESLMSFAHHEPVLLREVLENLNIQTGKWYLDCTLGDGGHSIGILKRGGNVVGLDVDPEALERARERLEELGGIEELGRYELIQGNFRDLKILVGKRKFAGVLFDLGASSLQFQDPARGFSFVNEGPLDMRMDPSLEVKALDLINALNKGELYELFNKLGEEKFARRIVDALVRAREMKGIRTTKDLADLVVQVYRQAGIKKSKIHPATRIFQALRIAVNDELNALQEALPQALELLEKNGKILVISFHSLEDRIVKNQFKDWETKGFGKVATKKTIVPSDFEINNNPRSRSAKLRVFYV